MVRVGGGCGAARRTGRWPLGASQQQGRPQLVNVFHQKFGMGNILTIDGDKLLIAFDKLAIKVVSGFVSNHDHTPISRSDLPARLDDRAMAVFEGVFSELWIAPLHHFSVIMLVIGRSKPCSHPLPMRPSSIRYLHRCLNMVDCPGSNHDITGRTAIGLLIIVPPFQHCVLAVFGFSGHGHYASSGGKPDFID